jgi:putative lipoprotein
MRAFLASLVICLSTATTAMADLQTIDGTATYRERMALPEGAVLEVESFHSARAEATSPALVGPIWVAEDIDQRGVIDNLQSHVTFTPEARVQGSGGCNAFTGGYSLAGDRLQIGTEAGQLAATLKACPEAVMDQEARFTDALGRVRSWRLDRGLLFLLDAEDTAILRLWQRQP